MNMVVLYSGITGVTMPQLHLATRSHFVVANTMHRLGKA